MRTKRLGTLLLVPLLVVATLAVACGGDDDNEPDASTAGAEEVGPGVVSAKPEDATQVDITLREFAIQTGQSSVAAGKVYFLAENTGPDDPHEFVVIRTDLGPLDLPFEDNKVPEDQIELVDEIEPFAPDSSASITVDLTAGKYLLICNITEVEADGEIESHYKKGMVATFTVES